MLVNRVDDSGWSSDYDRLVNLMKEQSIVCTIDYSYSAADTPIRDIAKTAYRQEKWEDEGVYEIGVRGLGYFTTWAEESFKASCQKHNVRFFDPEAGC
jgi:hypothetical protein